MPQQPMVSLRDLLNRRRDVDVEFFGTKVSFAYNPGAFDDSILERLNTGVDVDLESVIEEFVDDEDLARQIAQAVREALAQQNVNEFILETLQRVVVDLPITGDDGQTLDKDDALAMLPVPLRGQIFRAVTEDVNNGAKKSGQTERKRSRSRRPKSSFDATS